MSKTNPNDAAADDLRAMGLPTAFTMDDLRASLTSTELAALSKDEDDLIRGETPEDIKAAAVEGRSAYDEMQYGGEDDDGDDPDGDGDGDADDDQDENDDPDADEGAEGDGEGDTDGGAAGDDDPDADAQADQPPAETDTTPDPVLTFKDTAELQTKLDEALAAPDRLLEQYEDGELTTAELQEKMKAATKEAADLQFQMREAEKANEAARNDYVQAWYGKVADYTASHPELVDQTPIPGLPEGASAFTVFNNACLHVTGEQGRAKYGHLTMAQKIKAAAEITAAYVEKTAGKPLVAAKAPAKATDKKADGKKAEKPGPRTDKRPARVQTLGDVPAASDMDVQDSQFAALDKMNPMEAEKALAKMSKADRERYLAGA